MIVVDSSVWISFFAGFETAETRRLPEMASHDPILVGDIVLLEVLRGTRSDREFRRIEDQLRQFEVRSMINPDLAVAAARYYKRLRSEGVTVRNAADLIIGTYCIEYGYALLQRDRDYAPMQQYLGLRLA